jgi:hypothetical protein
MLRAYLDGGHADAPVWPGTWVEKAAKMLRRDPEAAGVPYVDGDGGNCDFHSSRHRFGTELAVPDVSTKVLQTLMRHSTITLTSGRYTHAGSFDVAGAVEKLSPLPGPDTIRAEVQALQATGGRKGEDLDDPDFPVASSPDACQRCHFADVAGRMPHDGPRDEHLPRHEPGRVGFVVPALPHPRPAERPG